MSDGRGAVPRGLRVAVTRSEGPGGPLSMRLRAIGAEPISVPLTETLPPSDPTALDRAISGLPATDWLIITSGRTVGPLVESLSRAGVPTEDVRSMDVRVCAVGPGTAEALRSSGLAPNLVPERFHAEGVVEAIAEKGDAGGLRVLLPRAEEGRDTIPRLLAAAGADVRVVPAYRTVPLPDEAARLCRLLENDELDLLTFTAGSSATAFARAWYGGDGLGRRADSSRPDLPEHVGVLALGPATASTLEEVGIRVDAIADPHTFESLALEVRRWADARSHSPRGSPGGDP